MFLNRRAVLASGALAPIAAEAAAPAPPQVTKSLADYIVGARFEDLPAAVRKQAARSFLNWVGVTVGGSREEAVTAAIAALSPFAGKPEANLLGRGERLDICNAALINGISSHIFDFDDTHLKTIIHPAGPVASALLALAEVTGASGREVIDALVLGIDVSCRVGNCIYPEHYDRGWHITGSTGMLGAAAGCARLMKLDEQRTMMALGIAASQPIGMREQFGTMTKPFHPGAAARAGLTSALLAKNGFTASPRAIEAPRGYAQVVSPKYDWNEITHELGERFEISFNTYKPFACGIVIHPTIDAAVQLRAKGVTAEDVERVELRVNPLVLELTGKKEPQDGLQGKFSVYHGFAAGLIFGRAGEGEYDDAIVRREDVTALRRKVVATVDESIDEAAADVTAILKDGRKVRVFVEHAIGSLERPMSDKDLEMKFHSMADAVIGAAKASALIDACWKLGEAKDVRDITGKAKP